MKKRGTKQEVFDGLAEKTNGGLKKEDLILNKRGAIVSKKRSEQGAKQFKNIENFAKSKKKQPKAEENLKLEDVAGGAIEKPELKAEDKLPELKSDNENNIPELKAEIKSEAPASSAIELKPEAVQEEKSIEQTPKRRGRAASKDKPLNLPLPKNIKVAPQ